MIYSIVKFVLRALTSVFFHEIQTVGEHTTPLNGPLIICGNHSNQFVDPMMILTNCPRQTSFLMAESVRFR